MFFFFNFTLSSVNKVFASVILKVAVVPTFAATLARFTAPDNIHFSPMLMKVQLHN